MQRHARFPTNRGWKQPIMGPYVLAWAELGVSGALDRRFALNPPPPPPPKKKQCLPGCAHMELIASEIKAYVLMSNISRRHWSNGCLKHVDAAIVYNVESTFKLFYILS